MRDIRFISIILGTALCLTVCTGCEDSSNEKVNLSSSTGTVSSVSTENGSGVTSSGLSSDSEHQAGSSDGGSVSSSSSSVKSSSSSVKSSSSSVKSSSSPVSSSSKQSSTVTHKHTYTSTIVNPTCTEAGYTLKICSCGDRIVTDQTEALGHNYNQTVIAPDCTKDGYTVYKCSRCGYEYNDDFTEALGHDFSKRSVNATCESDGYDEYICETCGYSYKDNISPATGHSWGDWIIQYEPTAVSEGKKYRECNICAHTEYEDIPAIPDEAQNFVSEVVRLVNIERAKEGIAPLEETSELDSYAAVRAEEISVNFAHVRPDGTNPLDYVIGLGGIHTAGENIAAGQRSPAEVVDDWMHSEGHRKNIMNPRFTKIGVGCYKSKRLNWVQIFAG